MQRHFINLVTDGGQRGEARCYIVRGDPNSGITTALRHIARALVLQGKKVVLCGTSGAACHELGPGAQSLAVLMELGPDCLRGADAIIIDDCMEGAGVGPMTMAHTLAMHLVNHEGDEGLPWMVVLGGTCVSPRLVRTHGLPWSALYRMALYTES